MYKHFDVYQKSEQIKNIEYLQYFVWTYELSIVLFNDISDHSTTSVAFAIFSRRTSPFYIYSYVFTFLRRKVLLFCQSPFNGVYTFAKHSSLCPRQFCCDQSLRSFKSFFNLLSFLHQINFISEFPVAVRFLKNHRESSGHFECLCHYASP